MQQLFTAARIRAAEAPLLAAQAEPDELMRAAAHAVARAAADLLAARENPRGRHSTTAASPTATGTTAAGTNTTGTATNAPAPDNPRDLRGRRVVALAGSGGNGGDALYAAAELSSAGAHVTAVLCGSHPHEAALAAFREAGGETVDASRVPLGFALGAELALDGVTGIGGRPGLRPRDAALFAELALNRVPVLAVDVPSGLSADTAAAPAEVAVDRPGLPGRVPGHVTAFATVTFGGLRRVHALSPACGQVLLADISVPGHPLPLSATLADAAPAPAGPTGSPSDAAASAVASGDETGDGDSAAEDEAAGGDTAGDGAAADATAAAAGTREAEEFLTCAVEWPRAAWSGPARPLSTLRLRGGLEPAAGDDKYSGGVVGVLAGSARYPGAGVLACAGALRATPSMVRYVGTGAENVLAAHPEVVATETLAEAGRVQAWVVGPGRGTDGPARAELAELLGRDEPVVVDADAVTLLAGDPALRAAVARHGRCLLTPHAGEFARLVRGMAAGGEGPDGETGQDRMSAARDVAERLNATVLLKGRLTVVASPELVTVVDAGHSWAATPGSGDVLSGICGAWVARGGSLHAAAVTAVTLHARAAWIAAQTPDGPAPIVASDIAAALPRATAQLSA